MEFLEEGRIRTSIEVTELNDGVIKTLMKYDDGLEVEYTLKDGKVSLDANRELAFNEDGNIVVKP